MPNRTILLLTDFSYQAKGRDYSREDVELSQLLRKYFKICISHIADAEKFLSIADAILIRNTGPQNTHHNALMQLRKRKDLALFNDLQGKGDINGKHHLKELFDLGFPVIPTFISKEEIEKRKPDERYLLKPIDGADSHGVKMLTYEELLLEDIYQNNLVQPLIDFQYEVSFYFIGNQFYYSLYAPHPQKRWALEPYPATKEDIEFAAKFIHWNSCKFGIQRVDACRTQGGELLLMELEDYNPFLSLNLLQNADKMRFLEGLHAALENLMGIER